MNPETLVFIMTDRCNASCRMCCFSCGPSGKQLLNMARMKEYMDQAKELGTIETIAYSGGEAFTHYDQLKECVAYAARLGFNVTLATNGFWAGNDEGVRLMGDLVRAGLRQVSISLDKYHQEYVPMETARRAARVLSDLGVLSIVTVMDAKDGTSLKETLDNMRPEIYGPDLILYPMFNAGAAKGNFNDDQFIKACRTETARCPFSRDIVVLFDGSLMMCCSQYSQDIPIAQLGKFDADSLETAVTRLKQSDFIYVMLNDGFGWYVERAGEFGCSFDQFYGVPCELCHDIFTNGKLVEELAPLVRQEAGKLRVAKLLSGNGRTPV
jgi:hypothetical protein